MFGFLINYVYVEAGSLPCAIYTFKHFHAQPGEFISRIEILSVALRQPMIPGF